MVGVNVNKNSKNDRKKLVGHSPLQIHCLPFSTLLFALGLTCMDHINGFLVFGFFLC